MIYHVELNYFRKNFRLKGAIPKDPFKSKYSIQYLIFYPLNKHWFRKKPNLNNVLETVNKKTFINLIFGFFFWASGVEFSSESRRGGA